VSTKKVKQLGKFGVRYGVGIRKALLVVEKKQRVRHECPVCGFEKVSRQSTGIFNCAKCNLTFAGGAYTPSTGTGKIIKKMVEQKSFVPKVAELAEAREVSPAKREKKGKQEGRKGR
jgi:large subunit ribosomal protein L37Ae